MATISEKNYRRIIAIGDLHGHLGPLEKLIEIISPNDRDLIIFIGDYIDRGPESKSVVNRMLEFKFYGKGFRFLRGNHEDMLLGNLGFKAVISDIDTWLYNGGVATLRSYGMDYDEIEYCRVRSSAENYRVLSRYIPESHVKFFLETEMWIESEKFFFCHGGVSPDKTIEEGKKNVFDLLWIREHIHRHNFPFWEKTVVCGHTPVKDVIIKDKLICVDTGLHYYGILSAVDVLSGEVYQVNMFR